MSRNLARFVRRCVVCGQPLDPAMAALGDRAHPTCDPDSEAN